MRRLDFKLVLHTLAKVLNLSIYIIYYIDQILLEHTYTRTHTRTHTHAHTHVHTHAHTRTHTRTHTFAN